MLYGLDGCKAGWLVAAELDGRLQFRIIQSIYELSHSSYEPMSGTTWPSLSDAEATVIDIPIGLFDGPACPPRSADVEARRILDGKTSSVFNPPSRFITQVDSYASGTAPGLTPLGFALRKRVRDVDDVISPELQRRVVESHPELAFRALHSHMPLPPKRTPEGASIRCALLEAAHSCFAGLQIRISAIQIPKSVALPDDFIDACAMLQVAQKIRSGTAVRVPPHPPVDAKGLRMEMWF
jgi:predicted RNase H-like nuclease